MTASAWQLPLDVVHIVHGYLEDRREKTYREKWVYLQVPDAQSGAYVSFREIAMGYVMITTRHENVWHGADLSELAKAVKEEAGQIEKAYAEAKDLARRLCYLCDIKLQPMERVVEKRVQCDGCNYRVERVCGAHQRFGQMMDTYDHLALSDPNVTRVTLEDTESENGVECRGYCYCAEDEPDSDYVEEEDEERTRASDSESD